MFNRLTKTDQSSPYQSHNNLMWLIGPTPLVYFKKSPLNAPKHHIYI
jgi:hypothetical protein